MLDRFLKWWMRAASPRPLFLSVVACYGMAGVLLWLNLLGVHFNFFTPLGVLGAGVAICLYAGIFPSAPRKKTNAHYRLMAIVNLNIMAIGAMKIVIGIHLLP